MKRNVPWWPALSAYPPKKHTKLPILAGVTVMNDGRFGGDRRWEMAAETGCYSRQKKCLGKMVLPGRIELPTSPLPIVLFSNFIVLIQYVSNSSIVQSSKLLKPDVGLFLLSYQILTKSQNCSLTTPIFNKKQGSACHTPLLHLLRQAAFFFIVRGIAFAFSKAASSSPSRAAAITVSMTFARLDRSPTAIALLPSAIGTSLLP